MKKRLLAMFLAMIMVFTTLSVNAGVQMAATVQNVNEDVYEVAESKQENAGDLFAIDTNDFYNKYVPADKYGNLIGAVSFDYQNANTDASGYLPALPSIGKAGSCTFDYVADPLGKRDGYVLDVSAPASVHRLLVNIYNSDELYELQTGKYRFEFDAYTSADAPKDTYFRLDIGTSTNALYFNSLVYANRGTSWTDCVVEFEVTAVGEETATVVYVNSKNETVTEEISKKPTFGIWLQKNVEAHTYFDDFMLYYFPENTAVWIDQSGKRANTNISKMTSFPAPSQVINNSDDSVFGFWKDSEGNLHRAGEAVTAEELEYNTFVAVDKMYTYFEFGDKTGKNSDMTVIPYPSEVDSTWSDDGFYGWTADGVYYRPGDEGDMSLFTKTLKAVMIAEYNATLPTSIINEKGVLVLKEDFSTTVFSKAWEYKPFGYIDSQYSDTVYSVSNSAAEMVTDDDAHGTAFKLTSTSGTNWSTAGTTKTPADPIALKTGAGKYTISYDVKNVVGSGRIDWNGASGNKVSYNGTSWSTVSESKDLESAPTRVSIYTSTSAGGDDIIDNICLYYMPENAVVFDNADGSLSFYYGNKSGNIVIPAPSAVNANWSDSTFAGWTATNGTVYSAGQTVAVSALAGQILKNEVEGVTFKFGNDFAKLTEIATIPYPSEINTDWSDAGFYAWSDEEDDYYFAGDEASIENLRNKTLSVVSIADYNATLPESIMNEKGILVLKEDFSTTVFSKAWEYKPFGYIDSQYSDTVYSVSNSAAEMVTDDDAHGTAFKLTSTSGTNWSTAGTTKTPADPIALKTGAGKYTISYDVKNVVGSGRIDWNGASGNKVSYNGTSWSTVSESKDLESAPTRVSIYTSTSAGGDDIIDNICLYYMPENAVVFDNADGSQSLYYGDKNGNIVVPVPSAVNAKWSDSTFAGWTATNGTVYSAGQTVAVSALAGQVLKNEIWGVSFKYGSKSVKLTDFESIPSPSEVSSAWSDKKFYAWVDEDGNYYYAGDSISADSLLNHTLTYVSVADYNATNTDIVTENGILILKEDFSTTKYSKRNGAENGQNSWSYETIGYTNEKYVTTAYSFVSANNEIVDGAVELVATQNTRWSTAGADTDYKGDGAKEPMALKTGAGLYTVVYDVKSSTTGSKTFVAWGSTNDYQKNMTAGVWETFKASHKTDAALDNVTVYIYGADATNIATYDNICLYYMPEDALVFGNSEGSYSVYYADENGNVVIPVPSDVNSDWSDEEFYAWKATDGTFYSVGTEVAVADFEGQYLELVTEDDLKPIMFNKTSIRLTGPNGFRMASFVDMDVRNQSTEYGYIVTRKVFLKDVDYDYDNYFVVPSDFNTENGSGMLDKVNVPFVTGVSYKPESGIDKIFAMDGSFLGDDINLEDGFARGGIYFTCVVTGLNSYDQYHEVLAIRPYIKIDGEYFYGETQEKSLYEAALAYQQKYGEGTSEYVDKIVSATNK